ncbi:hypothetical protein [Paraburkholderia sp. J12]|uniref:hypothetical protein n=1 Tax=Paraburkholderia sp. J12 TaxID=2805432 RepID=UPI002ABE052E|nr:hypothetical protein [Paraburkholderia sp. J12]
MSGIKVLLGPDGSPQGISIVVGYRPPGSLFPEFIDNLPTLFRGSAEQEVQCSHESPLFMLVQIDKREEYLRRRVSLVPGQFDSPSFAIRHDNQ